ncbi:MAG TPA: phosphatidate cytidylyltransferase [Candidatus Polarisedimenticolia bacterium]|nr:phosphatidate cytidylyltransferase [Candidatus Polarisedimenticolia bacterium]
MPAGSGTLRVLSAVVFLPIFWLIVKKLGTGTYELLLLAAALLGLFEMYALAAARGLRVHRLPGTVVALLLLASFAAPAAVRLEYGLVFALIVLPVASLWRGGDWGAALGEIGATLFAACFVGVFFGYLLALRLLTDSPMGDENGSDLVFLLFFIVWAGDTAAYVVGRFLGRRPLAPKVSPKKTVEGAIGGIAGSLLAAVVARAWFMHRLRPADVLILGLVLGLVGMVGDLVESMLKRGAGVKDSARLVPGHGGLLDRVDSLLYAAPVLYYYYQFAMRVS